MAHAAAVMQKAKAEPDRTSCDDQAILVLDKNNRIVGVIGCPDAVKSMSRLTRTIRRAFILL